MIRHVWSVLCERVSTDSAGTVSHLSCIEGLFTEGLPVKMQRLALSSRWLNEADAEATLTFRLEFVRPDGAVELLTNDASAKLNPMGNHRANILLDGLILRHAGVHRFRLYSVHEGEHALVADVPFNLHQTEPPKKAAPPPEPPPDPVSLN